MIEAPLLAATPHPARYTRHLSLKGKARMLVRFQKKKSMHNEHTKSFFDANLPLAFPLRGRWQSLID